MEMTQGKKFEKAPAGMCIGTIIDIVEMPKVPSTFNGVTTLKNKVRILWILNNINGTPMLDSEGKQLTVAFIKPASSHTSSDLYKLLLMLLGQAPPLMTKTEELEALLLGRSNVLFITRTPDTRSAGEFFANVTGASPLTPGMVAPVAPQGFVRAKNQPPKAAGQYAQAAPQPQQTQAVAQQPVASQPAQPANVPTTTEPTPPAPGAPPNNVSF